MVLKSFFCPKLFVINWVFLGSLFLSLTNFSTINSENQKLIKRIEKRCEKLFKMECQLIKLDVSLSAHPTELGRIINAYKVNNQRSHIGYVVYAEVYTCHFGGCATGELTVESTVREKLRYLIFMDNANSIVHIDVVDFESSYGYEISAGWWLKQFYGKKPGIFTLDANIDGISGATISCQQFIQSINQIDDCSLLSE